MALSWLLAGINFLLMASKSINQKQTAFKSKKGVQILGHAVIKTKKIYNQERTKVGNLAPAGNWYMLLGRLLSAEEGCAF